MSLDSFEHESQTISASIHTDYTQIADKFEAQTAFQKARLGFPIANLAFSIGRLTKHQRFPKENHRLRNT